MTILRFNHVTITDRLRLIRTISSVEQAAEILAKYWPRDNGEKLNAAREACVQARLGRVTPEDVRAAFIAAAEEAANHVKERTR